MIGLRMRMMASDSGLKRSPAKTSTNPFSPIILMSAPAANALSEPAITMQRTLSFSCASCSAVTSSPSS